MDEADSRSSRVSLVCSMAMSLYSVSFIHEDVEEYVEGMLASGHQRAG